MSINLTPNLGSTPTGTFYRVKYAASDQQYFGNWVVPTSASPANLLAVRVLTPPVPSVNFPIDQVLPPVETPPGQILEWNGTQWMAVGGASSTLEAATLIEAVAHTPSSSSDTGTTGQFAWDGSFIYICVATNTWQRVATATW